jgi:hypothetical protein
MSLVRKLVTYAIGTQQEIQLDGLTNSAWRMANLAELALGVYGTCTLANTSIPESLGTATLAVDGLVRIIQSYLAVVNSSTGIETTGPGIIGTFIKPRINNYLDNFLVGDEERVQDHI